MLKFLTLFISLSLVTGVSFGQVSPLESGDTLSQDGHEFGMKSLSGIVRQPENKYKRDIKITLEGNGNRRYNFANGRLVWLMDKEFAKLETRSGVIPPTERLPLFPKDKPLTVGAEWDVRLNGYSNQCGAWVTNLHANAKNGPDTKILINEVEVSLKIISITFTYVHQNSNIGLCDTIENLEFKVLYSPELNEVIVWEEKITKTGNSGQYLLGYNVTTRAITRVKK